MRDEGKGQREDVDFASIVQASKASGRPSSIVMVLLALLMLFPACGYHFSGTGGIVPEGVKTISVPVFFNATNEPYVDVEVTQAVVEEFMTDGRLKVISLEDAELALRGKVTSYEVTPLSYDPASFVQQYRVLLVVEARLEDVRSKKILWQEAGIQSSLISDYPVKIGDIRATRVAKDAAIKKASQDIAWTLRSRVLEGF